MIACASREAAVSGRALKQAHILRGEARAAKRPREDMQMYTFFGTTVEPSVP